MKSEMSSEKLSKLSQVSMLAVNLDAGLAFADVVSDWFKFMGGKPGEVVVVNHADNIETQRIYWQLFQDRLIDKLQLIHSQNKGNKNFRNIEEYTAATIASKPYLLLFKADALPYRKGNNHWLEEAIEYLDRGDVFAIIDSSRSPEKHHDAWSGWYFSHKFNYSLALIKRSAFISATSELGDGFIHAEVQTETSDTVDHQLSTEIAFEQYMKHHSIYTLCKTEQPDWKIVHPNSQADWKSVREKHLVPEEFKKV